MGYGLPTSVEINGMEFPIRYDFRVILDIFEALNDPELDDQERSYQHTPKLETAYLLRSLESAVKRQRGNASISRNRSSTGRTKALWILRPDIPTPKTNY